MIVVDVEVDAPARRLREIRERLENPRPLLQLMGGLLVDYEREVFATRGHGRWAGDDRATTRAKGNGRVLVDTGDLLRHLTDPSIDGDSVVVNQGDSYYGAFLKAGSRGMPRRDPAPTPDRSTVDGWADQVLGYLVDGRR